MENNEKFHELREKYKNFIYEKFEITDTEKTMDLKFYFTIEGLKSFEPEIRISKKELIEKHIDLEKIKPFAFHIGMIELISYWKATCSPNVIIKCGNLDVNQIQWFKKLYFYGLGELFFTNGIKTSIEDFMDIKCESNEVYQIKENIAEQNYTGYLIPIGGGKDSVVTLESLKKTKNENLCLIVNPKPVTLGCADVAGYSNERIVEVNRKIDTNIMELNSQGYINGHTPFSSLLAFLSYFIGYLTKKKYVALSNESSSNESNVVGEKVNHQYSKSFEFENDFRNYVDKYIEIPTKYFSFLRPLNELQIAYLFSKNEQYHQIFKSCNVGSKGKEWKWCCNCPKCLFVYIILSPFLYKEKLVDIFKWDLFKKKELLKTFIELTGNGETKPFECVGTYNEVKYAISQTIGKIEKNNGKLPYLLQYYKEKFELIDLKLLEEFNDENNLNEEQEKILKEEIYNG